MIMLYAEQGLAAHRDLTKVLEMVAEMKRTDTCILDRVAYTAIVDACIEAGSPISKCSAFGWHMCSALFSVLFELRTAVSACRRAGIYGGTEGDGKTKSSTET